MVHRMANARAQEDPEESSQPAGGAAWSQVGPVSSLPRAGDNCRLEYEAEAPKLAHGGGNGCIRHCPTGRSAVVIVI
ncbi:hypothetical protein QLX08_011543 [Tetragonisca angustula]|uniref:Uncharacterized protein n=1 Tax=Tetragonisca angustula TaxID=166442 RepID=A0AAW0Z7N7_9HYME